MRCLLYSDNFTVRKFWDNFTLKKYALWSAMAKARTIVMSVKVTDDSKMYYQCLVNTVGKKCKVLQCVHISCLAIGGRNIDRRTLTSNTFFFFFFWSKWEDDRCLLNCETYLETKNYLNRRFSTLSTRKYQKWNLSSQHLLGSTNVWGTVLLMYFHLLILFFLKMHLVAQGG